MYSFIECKPDGYILFNDFGFVFVVVVFVLCLLLFFRGGISFEKLTSTKERDSVKSGLKMIGEGAEEINFDKKLGEVKC